MKKMVGIMFILSMVVFTSVHAADVSDLENLTLQQESHWNGSDLEGSYKATDYFTTGTASFNNFYAYDAVYMYSSWGGFAYSNITDTTATGFTAQYNAIPGSGHGGSSIYAVGYENTFEGVIPTITFDAVQTVNSVMITNTNYVYDAMLNGYFNAKKFGGDSGDDEDWFLLTITGKDANEDPTGTVEFYLADFRFADNAADYIVADWREVDLRPLGMVKTLEFTLTSSDSGQYGMNTPAYFAMDTVNGVGDFETLTLATESYWNGSALEGSYKATDEFTSGIATYNSFYAYDDVYMYSSWGGFAYSNITDTTATGFSAQYNAIPGSGHGGSRNYAIGYENTFEGVIPTISFEAVQTIKAIRITNTTYTYDTMRNGYFNAKKFGGDSGDDEDWFLLTITGKDANEDPTGTVEFYLADYRFGDNSEDYIIDEWALVELSSLGGVKSLEFRLSSSDGGQGLAMNTPAYFAIDSVNDYDDDGDGYSEAEGDCNDDNADINPDIVDICGDGIDQDCSGSDLSCDDDDDNWLKGCFITVTERSIK